MRTSDMTRYVVRDCGHTSPCWVWTGSLSSGGYGRVQHQGRHTRAHRVMFEQVHGLIAEGLQLDHLCRVRACVNPAHLEAVTPRENTLRGEGVTSLNARKAFCKRGHALTGDNLDTSNGRRRCRACKAMHNAAHQASLKLASAA